MSGQGWWCEISGVFGFLGVGSEQEGEWRKEEWLRYGEGV